MSGSMSGLPKSEHQPAIYEYTPELDAARRSRARSGSVQSLSHFWFRLSGPEAGSGGDGTSHLLVLQQLDVQISLGRPSGAGDVPEPGGSEVERRLPIRECPPRAYAAGSRARCARADCWCG